MLRDIMDKVEVLMDEFYEVLRQIRYPKITGASSKSIQSAILTGENRISLLSWLLIEKSTPALATKLQNLKGPTLEAELLRLYSEMGICKDKRLLLGNCSIENQLPFLALLLNFIESVFLEPVELNGEEGTEDATNARKESSLSGIADSVVRIIEPKLSYPESTRYFDDSRKYLDDRKDSLRNHGLPETREPVAQSTETEDEETDWHLTSIKETQYFVEDFGSNRDSWQVPVNARRTVLPQFDDVIGHLSEILSSIDKFFDSKEIISTADIPERIQKLHTDLNEIVEESSECAEKIKSFYADSLY